MWVYGTRVVGSEKISVSTGSSQKLSQASPSPALSIVTPLLIGLANLCELRYIKLWILQSLHLAIYFTNFVALCYYCQHIGGEELFGLPVTPYPELEEVRKQLNLLQKLYGLYNNVISSVNGYYDILWAEINIDKINEELLDFQNRSKFYF